MHLLRRSLAHDVMLFPLRQLQMQHLRGDHCWSSHQGWRSCHPLLVFIFIFCVSLPLPPHKIGQHIGLNRSYRNLRLPSEEESGQQGAGHLTNQGSRVQGIPGQ